MFDTLMTAFREAGVSKYFLFTDTTCDVGFYVHLGLAQVSEHTLPTNGDGEQATSFYLREGSQESYFMRLRSTYWRMPPLR